MTALTSTLAFRQTASKREVQEQKLYSLYQAVGPLSDREAYNILDWEAPSVVSARRSSLVKRGLVVELGRQKDKNTSKTVSIWGITRETLF